ncbi:MAG: efflux RND transporter periplasmic adaptor subunit, partial [bacterium]
WVITAIAGRGPDLEYTTVEAVHGKLVQTVIETGTVKPIHELNLNFMSSGRLDEILAKIGDEVIQNQVLVKLDLTDLLIKQREAQANLNVAQANFNKLVAGASSSEVSIEEANKAQSNAAYEAAVKELDKAKKTAAESLSQAEKNYHDLTSIADGATYEETNLDNTKRIYKKAVDNKTETLEITLDNKLAVTTTALDAIYRILNDDDIDDYLSVRNLSVLNNTNTTYSSAMNLLSIAKTDLSLTKAGSKDISLSYSSAMAAVNKSFESLNYCFSALENSTTSIYLTQSELDTFKSGISTQLTNVSTAISSLQTAKQNLDDAVLSYETEVAEAESALSEAIISAEQALATAKVTNAQNITIAESKVDTTLKSWKIYEAKLLDIKSPARTEDIMLKRAQVNQAQAQLELINNQIDQNIIKAPIDGIVTKIEFEVGEQISPTEKVVTMLADHNFILELDISETDISKLRLGNLATVTIDAYGDDIVFPGTVIFIEPAETEIQGVVYYKVDVDFDPNDYVIKSGMTASADIITEEKENVLMIPIRAVLEKDGYKVVRVLFGKSVQEMPVEIGILGDEGMVEVLSGIKAGDQVVTYIKNNGK